MCTKNPKQGFNKVSWSATEDSILAEHVRTHGEGRWGRVPKRTGLNRCPRSCRLRWLNYLRPDIKRGNISIEEEDLIIRLHNLLGNRWSLIAGRLPGRTDNEIKNYWNTVLKKKKLKVPSVESMHSNGEGDQKCKSKKEIGSPQFECPTLFNESSACKEHDNRTSKREYKEAWLNAGKIPDVSFFSLEDSYTFDQLMGSDIEQIGSSCVLDIDDLEKDQRIWGSAYSPMSFDDSWGISDNWFSWLGENSMESYILPL
ncbi:transcription factor MYB1-like [Zingiber officinale]|uniref:Uncharacterized protein n=1 Tax=Zingiber officinale TaxID=94328 RepID=A0A8J5LTJ4_ZINOF|nr:transcription factor MYB1-like [Zingiber officinale]KAG6538439.1 hypothetical protein ZIOFF_003561 [Zingiber officinale]